VTDYNPLPSNTEIVILLLHTDFRCAHAVHTHTLANRMDVDYSQRSIIGATDTLQGFDFKLFSLKSTTWGFFECNLFSLVAAEGKFSHAPILTDTGLKGRDPHCA
jgi:hypothetical protein